ncbi:MAG: MFS transporter [Chitinophagaceae bacterium]|nr:MFS transporter [Chitinophagaceae bacterium]
MLFLAAILFLISAIGFSFSENYSILISFRVLAGMAVGVASNISPLYISEIAPARNRGAFVTFYQLAITIGILVAYLSNYFIQLSISQNSSSLLAGYFPGEAWRLMFFVSAIPATLFLFLLLVVPESPRWLMKQGRESASLSVLSKIHDPEEANKELLSIQKITASNNSGKIHLTKKPMATILILVMALTALSQFSGINGVIFYGPTILHSAGIVTQDALLYQVMLGAANMLFTLIAIWKVDSWGRRPLYIYGSLFAGIALALTGLCFAFDIKGYILLSCMMLFLLFFAFSLGPLKFVLLPNSFQQK